MLNQKLIGDQIFFLSLCDATSLLDRGMNLVTTGVDYR